MNALRKILLSVALGTVGALLLGAAPAVADYVGYVGSFNGSGSTPTSGFVRPSMIAANAQNGDVVVLDEGVAGSHNGFVKRFDANGNPKPFSALGGSNTIGPIPLTNQEYWAKSTDIAIDGSNTASSGNIYVVSFEQPSRVYAFKPDGTPVGGSWPLSYEIEYGGPNGVFVDQGGKVWVSTTSGQVKQYTPLGEPTGAFREHGGGARIGYDSKLKQYELLTAGPYRVGSLDGLQGYDLGQASEANDVTIDFATDNAYVSNKSQVFKFDDKGLTLATFGAEDPAGTYNGVVKGEGVAFSALNGNIYFVDSGSIPPKVDIFNFVPPLTPQMSGAAVREVRSASAKIEGTVTARGGETSYRVEYGPTASYGSSVAGGSTLDGFSPSDVILRISGLNPGTKYHYRLAATNSTATTFSPDHTFSTYSFPQGGTDACPNVLARQQSGTSGLLDCRAYEQVSARDTGGYDVESNQIPNGAPLPGFPEASGPPRVAYTTSSGSIPGTDNPTGHLGDPYIATRSENGWSTSYVGLPANKTNNGQPFSSPLLDADGSLDTLAFGGTNFCSVCLPDGSGGIPVRTPSGQLVQGMAGSLNPAGAAPAGHVAKHFSADGTHFVFGSTAQFEPDGNSNGTDVSIYDRNLDTGVTHVVSKTPAGSTMTGAGIAALDINDDGSRILVAQKVATDSKGNDYWHLYMNVGDSGQTIDLTPGTTAGVLYNGMTSDGSQVLFSGSDSFTSDDHDASRDVYRADVSASGASLSRVSTGASGTGDTDSCNPVADYAHTRWNSLTAAASCDAVAIAGGGGVGAGDGTVYFLSPELLDGPSNGTANAPNLYAAPRGQAPHYISTLESRNDPPAEPEFSRSVASSFAIGAGALGFATDPDTGDFYVLKDGSGAGSVEKFDSSGNPSNWSFVASYVKGNKLTKAGSIGFTFNGGGQIAIDNSGGPADGYMYVTNSGSNSTAIFKASGEYVGALTGGCGAAVDPAGRVYTNNYFQNRRFQPVDGNPNNDVITELPGFGFTPCLEVTDSTGALYANNPNSFVKRFSAATLDTGSPKGTEYPAASTAIAVDATTGILYIAEGNHISQWDQNAKKVIGNIGAGTLVDVRGLWVSDGKLYASDFSTGRIYVFGPMVPAPDPVESNPLVVNAVESPAIRRTADFEVARNGGVAVFPSNLSLTGAPNERHVELYRADPVGDSFACISCTPSEAAAEGDANLPDNGRSITDDGRIFFTTAEPLVLRDAAQRKDVYEWSGGEVQLVSTGSSTFDATLLSASADGTDVYFFSREDLLATGNGQAIKIFDARSGGGKFLLPTPALCAASDECHGPGTEPTPPQSIGTIAGKGGQHKQAKPCKKGMVKKHGKCVKKKKHKKHKKQKKNRKANSTRRNG